MKTKSLFLAIAVLALFFTLPSSRAADITFEAKPTPHFLLQGKIVKGDDQQLRQVMAQHPDIKTISLDSSGGVANAGMKMGRILRAAQVATTVENDTECSSSCVLILAGGSPRTVAPGARIGFHAFQIQKASGLGYSEEEWRVVEPLEAAYIQEVAAYLIKMGVSPIVISAMMAVPADDIRFVDADYCREHGLAKAR